MRKKTELFLIIFLILVSVCIKSTNFVEHLNFSYDQAWGSTKALEIWRNKELTLVGPGTSLVANHKEILQGSVIYYFQLIFLLMGNFDPIKSSYFFMLFSSLMLIPLYLGIKNLANKQSAFFISIIYAFLPLYIDHTRFFFGPNFQLSLLPLLLYFMGLEKIKKSKSQLFLVFLTAGILMQFHYGFSIIILGLLTYYIISSKSKLSTLILSSLGLLLGFSPMILFELKNQFYNTQVLKEYLQLPKRDVSLLYPHRFLSISLMIFSILVILFRKKINKSINIFAFILLLILDLSIYLPKPSHAFGMSSNWNYLMEKKAYKIIKNEDLNNFNIVNHIYDNLAVVIKYQMKKDNYSINFDDYYHNDYLFVISKNPKIFSDPAYELNTFKPSKLMKKWELNDNYDLYLFKRLKNKL